MSVLITAVVPGQTQEGYDATMFFAKYIHPNLPPGVTPQRTYLELHSLVVQPQEHP